MKIDKLFKKINKFFTAVGKNNKKRDELILALDNKISSMKETIKDEQNKEKAKQLKKELNILKNIRKNI